LKPNPWPARIGLAMLILATMPAAIDSLGRNIEAIAALHCRSKPPLSVGGFPTSGSESEETPGLLFVRLCQQEIDKEQHLRILLEGLRARQSDPILHYSLSRLFRSLGLMAEAEHELAIAVSDSPSVIWNANFEQICGEK
jgi:hypothetical protein